MLPENEKFSAIRMFIEMDHHVSAEIHSVGHSVNISWLPTLCQVFCKAHNLALRRGQIQQLCLPGSRQELQVGFGTDRKAAQGCICGLRHCPGKVQPCPFLWRYKCMPERSSPLEPLPAGLEMVLTSPRRCLDDVPARPPVSS